MYFLVFRDLVGERSSERPYNLADDRLVTNCLPVWLDKAWPVEVGLHIPINRYRRLVNIWSHTARRLLCILHKLLRAGGAAIRLEVTKWHRTWQQREIRSRARKTSSKGIDR